MDGIRFCTPVSEGSILGAAILFVDDDARNLEIARGILERRGFANVTTESNPLAVFDTHLVEQGRVFDLILLDLMMPELDGFGVMARLCSFENTAPIIVLTALDDTDSRHRAFAAGARDYLTKPFTAEEMHARVHNLLLAHLSQQKLSQENIALDEAVRQRTEDLERSKLEALKLLGRAAEYRDNETGLHVVRMAKFSQIIAIAAVMDNNKAEQLLHAAPMHDIGKIGIPDSILLKPGRLDEKEWEVMKTHATIGAEILQQGDSDVLRLAAEIAITHHEKWDGSGYPHGLVGEAIPLSGRIIAIADVFDALTSERPYKKVWPIEKAVELIQSEEGKHFDPRLVKLFLTVLPEIIEIREQLLDKRE